MADLNTGRDEAFGIVPILRKADQYKFLLIQHNAGHWGFPKGHAEPNESPIQAACREFAEETGISDYTLLGETSFSEQYVFTRNGQKFNKTVTYYPAFVRSTTVQYQKEEIQNYIWLDYDGAIALLTFEGARRVLTSVNQYLETVD